MRFLKPAPGECADRQTILQLKIKYGSGNNDAKTVQERISVDPTETIARVKLENASPVNVQPFIDENELIQQYLEINYFPDIAAFEEKQKKFDKFFEQILEVNEDLWRLEDRARILRNAPDKESLPVLKRKSEVLDLITGLNDQRAMLVKQINSLWNIYGQEKLYK